MTREELRRLGDWVRSNGFGRVMVQCPPGLTEAALEVSAALRSMGVDVVMSGSACWGGCDVSVKEAVGVGCDAVVHVGHARFVDVREVPVFYYEARYNDYEPLSDLLPKLREHLEGKRTVSLGMTVQWLDFLERFAEDLRAMGLEVLVGEPGGHLVHRGQVLGCDYSTMLPLDPLVDAHVVVGSVFHGLGLALTARKEVYAADPHAQRVTPLGELTRRTLMKRYGQIERFRSSRRVGVVVSVKPGQRYFGLARWIAERLRSKGYEAEVVVVDEVRPEELEGRYEALVNTACPRLSVEDQERFRVPVLLPGEAMVALGELGWEELLERGLISPYPQGWVMALTRSPGTPSASSRPGPSRA
ncbi:MAG: diphthamide biosynthesis enzyme Dph2 [Aigarchaeota archaeon]|nr:diphthamide biosynthesis enzyme Dph2 [Aigarchaeota archaeon]MDW8043831.1 diphthamide biosynthesis enzyme Dph2 [Nitrososphaerota archaeon]